MSKSSRSFHFIVTNSGMPGICDQPLSCLNMIVTVYEKAHVDRIFVFPLVDVTELEV